MIETWSSNDTRGGVGGVGQRNVNTYDAATGRGVSGPVRPCVPEGTRLVLPPPGLRPHHRRVPHWKSTTKRLPRGDTSPTTPGTGGSRTEWQTERGEKGLVVAVPGSGFPVTYRKRLWDAVRHPLPSRATGPRGSTGGRSPDPAPGTHPVQGARRRGPASTREVAGTAHRGRIDRVRLFPDTTHRRGHETNTCLRP